MTSKNNSSELEIITEEGNIKDAILERIVNKAIDQNPKIYERLGKI